MQQKQNHDEFSGGFQSCQVARAGDTCDARGKLMTREKSRPSL